MTRTLAATVLVLTTLTACGGDDAPQAVTATLDARGGAIVSSDGLATLEFVAGRLKGPTKITLTTVPNSKDLGADALTTTEYRIAADPPDLNAFGELRIAGAPAVAQKTQALRADNGFCEHDDCKVGELLVCTGGQGNPVAGGLIVYDAGYEAGCWYVGDDPSVCPEGTTGSRESWHVLGQYTGPAIGCWAVHATVCALGDIGCLITKVNDSGQLVAAVPAWPGTGIGLFAGDKTPPSVSVTATLTPNGDASTLKLVATPADDRRIARVDFVRPMADGTYPILKTVAHDPYVDDWQTLKYEYTSAGAPIPSLLGDYLVVAYDLRGNAGLVFTEVTDIVPTITSFVASPTILDAPGQVTLTWATSGAQTVSIDNGVGVVAASGSATVSVASATTYTLNAVNAVGTTSRSVSISVASVNDKYVDAVNGSDANAGTFAAPFKTITHAAAVTPSGATIFLKDGKYDASTEGASIVSPAFADNITLRALTPQGATLSAFQINLDSKSFTVMDVCFGTINEMSSYIYAHGSAQAHTLTISGVRFNRGGTLQIQGNTVATMVAGSLTGTALNDVQGLVLLQEQAQLTVTGVTFDNAPANDNSGGSLFMLNNTAKLVLDGVTIKNWHKFVATVAAGTAVNVKNTVIADVGNSGSPYYGGAPFGLSGGSLTLDNTSITCSTDRANTTYGTGGISINTGANNVIVMKNNSLITKCGFMGIGHTSTDGHFDITIDHSSIIDDYNGLSLFGDGNLTIINGSKVDGNLGNTPTTTATGFGIRVYPIGGAATHTFTLKMRDSSLSANNGRGFFLDASTGNDVWNIDFGTDAEPGNNAIVNPKVSMYLNPPTAITVNAVGNNWQTTADDPDGHYDADVTGPLPANGTDPSGTAFPYNFVIKGGSTIHL